MEQPKGYGNFSVLLARHFTESEIRQVEDDIRQFVESPAGQVYAKLLEQRHVYWVDRLKHDRPPENRAVLDQSIGVMQGLDEAQAAFDAILHAAALSRTRLEREADERGQEGG